MKKIMKVITVGLFWWGIIFPQLTYPYKEIPKTEANIQYKLWILDVFSNN